MVLTLLVPEDLASGHRGNECFEYWTRWIHVSDIMEHLVQLNRLTRKNDSWLTSLPVNQQALRALDFESHAVSARIHLYLYPQSISIHRLSSSSIIFNECSARPWDRSAEGTQGPGASVLGLGFTSCQMLSIGSNRIQ